MEGMLNYFIPEDGDSSDHLNVVPLPRVEQLKLQHIKKCFPLPGEFHFRFKTPFEGTYVWLDVTNDADPVPDYNGLIISKIARVQSAATTRPPERVDSPSVQTHKAAPPPDLIETSPPPPAAKAPEPAPQAKPFNDDLVGLLSDPIPASSPRTTPAPAPAAAAPQQNSGAPVDPFNLFLGPANTNPMGRPNPAPMNMARGPTGPGNPGGFQGGGFAPMGGNVPPPMAPRPGGNIGISQMGQHMGMNQAPGQQGGGNSFSGLNWQGMGGQQQQQQPRPGMGMPQNGRQW